MHPFPAWLVVGRVLPAWLPVALIGCVSDPIADPDEAPTVVVVEPAAGSTVFADEPLVLVVEATDDGPLSDLDWVVYTEDADTPEVEVEAPDGDVVTITLPEGVHLVRDGHEVTVGATDPGGRVGSDTVALNVVANASPAVLFETPADGAVLAAHEPVEVRARVTDADGEITLVVLTWTGQVPDSGLPTTPTPLGTASFTLDDPAPGSYYVELLATDPLGGTGLASRSFEVAWSDHDEDGYGSDVDCDDLEASVHPGAVERCNGVDDNCDGVVDDDAEDRPTWYADLDDDGYGDDESATVRCEGKSGEVTRGGDCDDGHDKTHPGAVETCDERDNDCDDTTDEDAVDAPVWYADVDGDDAGDPSTAQNACDAPQDHVTLPGDCDDGDPLRVPGADELCDEVDNDCDGFVDEAAAIGATTWYLDADGDLVGDTSESVFACAAPPDHVATPGDCNDADDAVGGPTPWYTDKDKDGLGTDEFELACAAPSKKHAAVAGDCDDADEAVGAAAIWFLDLDGDGHGTDASTTIDCVAPGGFVAEDDDCDDTEPDNTPGRNESCDGIDNDCDDLVDEAGATDEVPWYADVDGDGFGDGAAESWSCAAPADHVADNTDCLDGDTEPAAVTFPGADELCDGVDNDCEPSTDEELVGVDRQTWYVDSEPDGYGDDTTALLVCDPPVTHTAVVGGDCDDSSAATHEDAEEVCDGEDNDCDATADEDVEDPPVWTLDHDGDGHGDEDGVFTFVGCDAPTGYVDNADDCDDDDDQVYWGAVEVCDSVDNDCDGDATEGVTLLFTWYRDFDSDEYGDADTTTAACGQPDGYVDNALDCRDDLNGVHPGVDEICENGIDDDCNGNAAPCGLAGDIPVSEADFIAQGQDDFGGEIVAGDLDGDGDDDLMVGAVGYHSVGGVFTFFGAEDFSLPDDMWEYDAVVEGASNNNQHGRFLRVGDATGDGIDDLLSSTASDVRLFVGLPAPGSSKTTVTTPTLASKFTFSCDGGFVPVAYGFFPGDVNHDGAPDVGMGYPCEWALHGGFTSGAAYVVFGSPGFPSLVAPEQDYGVVFAPGTGGYGNQGGVALGDLNGDTHDDFAIVYGDFAGSGLEVYHGPFVAGIWRSGQVARITTGVFNNPEDATHVAAGDTDGDGIVEIFLGNPLRDEASFIDAGEVGLFTAPFVTTPLGEAPTRWTGAAVGDNLGSRVATLDHNADGYADIAIAAPGVDHGGGNEGSVYLFNGPFAPGFPSVDDADAELVGTVAGGKLGIGLGAGDLDGDGHDDLAVGAIGTGVDWMYVEMGGGL